LHVSSFSTGEARFLDAGLLAGVAFLFPGFAFGFSAFFAAGLFFTSFASGDFFAAGDFPPAFLSSFSAFLLLFCKSRSSELRTSSSTMSRWLSLMWPTNSCFVLVMF
jgi:hypothetical protein